MAVGRAFSARGKSQMSKKSSPTPPRAWQRMLSGRRLDLLDPSPLDIEITDIAHGLAFVARWNGQTLGEYPYSVAEHSLLVEHVFTLVNRGIAPQWRLAALLHDAPEYVIGDMISPVKATIGPSYEVLDKRLAAAVHVRFGLPAELPVLIKKAIKQADIFSAWREAVDIAGFSQIEAAQLFPKPAFDLTGVAPIMPQPPSAVRHAFLQRFKELMSEIQDLQA
jgi:uncharacterized protein